MWGSLYRIILGLEELISRLREYIVHPYLKLKRFFLKLACIIEAHYVLSRIYKNSRGNITLRYADLEYMVAFLLMKGFEVVVWENFYDDVRRDYTKLMYGIIIIELHRRWVTCNPPTYMEWYTE